MDGLYFISYTPDAAEFVQRIQQDLANDVAEDRTHLELAKSTADDFLDPETDNAINLCQIFIAVVTSQSIHPQSSCQLAWQTALSYKKQIIVLTPQADVKIPDLLQAQLIIDFTDYAQGMVNLKGCLTNFHTPQHRLAKLQVDYRDAKQRLRQTKDSKQRQRIEVEMTEIARQISVLEQTVAHPQDVYEQTQQRIRASFKRAQQPASASKRVTTKFINNPALETKPHFQARQLETRRIGDWLKSPFVRIITIVGAGGVGKTAMLYRILDSLQKHGKMPDDGVRLDVDGIVYLSEIGTRNITVYNLYHDLLKLLAPKQEAELTVLYQNASLSTADKFKELFKYLLSGKVLVVLDNFEDVMDTLTGRIVDSDLAEALQTIAHNPHAIQIVVTTRNFPQDFTTFRAENHVQFTLAHLSAEDTFTLLRNKDAEARYGLRDASQILLDRAFAITQGHPRALEALVAILKVDSRTQLAEILQKAEWMIQRDNNSSGDIHILGQEAFKRLPELARQVMQTLAVFQRPVYSGAVDYVLQAIYPDIESAPILAWLVDADFVHREAGRYYLHPLDRAYVRTVLPSASSDFTYSFADLSQRAAHYYQHIQKPKAQWQTFDDLENNIAEYQMHLQAEAFEAAAKILTVIGFDYLILWGYAREVVKYYEPLYPQIIYSREITHSTQTANRKVLSNQSRFNAFFCLADAHDRLSNYAQAQSFCEAGISLAQAQNKRGWEGVFLSMLGGIVRSLGEIEQAIDYYEQALAIARERGDKASEGVRLGNLGNAYSHLDKLEQAIDYYEQALTIAEACGDLANQSVWIGNLGSRYMDLGQLDNAAIYYEKALDIAEALGDKSAVGIQIGNLGRVYHTSGDYDKALSCYKRALSIAQEVGDRKNESIWLGNLGNIQREQRQLSSAIEYHQQAYAINVETGYRRGQYTQVRNLARDYTDSGQFEQALDYYHQAASLAREIKYKVGERLCLNDLGNIYADLGQIEEAINYYEQAVACAREIGNRSAEGVYLANLGARFYEMGELMKAIEYHEEALIIEQVIGNQYSEVYSLDSLGQDYLFVDKFELAINYMQQAVALADKLKDIRAQVHTRWSLACGYLLQGQLSSARLVAEEALNHQQALNLQKVYVVHGVIALRQGDKETAEASFLTGIALIQEMLDINEYQHIILDELGLAYCGLALATDDRTYMPKAITAYQKARAIMSGIGHVMENLRLLEALSLADKQGWIDAAVYRAIGKPTG